MNDEPEKKRVFIEREGRLGDIRLSVNGQIKLLAAGAEHELTAWEIEALENSNTNFRILSSDDETGDGEGSPSPVTGTSVTGENRTDPHQIPALDASPDPSFTPAAIPGVIDEESGAPVLVGGDEPDPKVHGDSIIVHTPEPVEQPEEPAVPERGEQTEEQPAVDTPSLADFREEDHDRA